MIKPQTLRIPIQWRPLDGIILALIALILGWLAILSAEAVACFADGRRAVHSRFAKS